MASSEGEGVMEKMIKLGRLREFYRRMYKSDLNDDEGEGGNRKIFFT